MASRRELLKTGAGGIILSGLGVPALAQAATPDLTDPAEFLTAFVKMKGAVDGSLAISWLKGRRYAVTDGNTTPLFGIMSVTFFTYTRVDRLSFEMRSLELVYHTDLTTGKLLETWKNPATGKVVEVPQTRLGPSVVLIKPSGHDLSNNPGTMAMNATTVFRPALVVGNDVWITEEIKVAGDPPASGDTPFRYNEIKTLYAKLSDLSKPGRVSVPASTQYQSLVFARTWAGMEGGNSMQMSNCFGHRAERVDDLPPYFLELIETYHPEVLSDPIGSLNSE